MNKYLQFILCALLSISLTACHLDNTIDNRKSAEDTPEADEQATEADNSVAVTGKVLEILSGKDGYTAKIEQSDGGICFATISHANLNDPSQYKAFKAGDPISVEGEAWQMNNEIHVTVRIIN